MAAMPRRVVVTGVGVLTPIGVGIQAAWKAMLEGRTGTVSLAGRGNGAGQHAGKFDALPCTVAAVVDGLPDSSRRRDHVTRSTQMAVMAAAEALAMAKWDPKACGDVAGQEATGVSIGVGMSAVDEVAGAAAAYATGGQRGVSPFFVPRVLANMAGGHLSIEHGFMGPNHSVSTACATGLHAIGDAFRFIKHGDADVMLAGGAESCIDPLSLAAFCRMRAVATAFNDRPAEAARPFDVARCGFVMGEGAGMLVLEELEHARRRGATILAEISGYGMSGDAHHITTPGGKGARLAMERALAEAQAAPTDIDYANAHATSTPLGDETEMGAIKAVFGEHAARLAVSSCKGAIGHLLGAAGAVEAAMTVLAVQQDTVPPTANLTDPAPGMLDCVPLRPRALPLRAAVKNSFGFGGTNASIVIRKAPA